MTVQRNESRGPDSLRLAELERQDPTLTPLLARIVSAFLKADPTPRGGGAVTTTSPEHRPHVLRDDQRETLERLRRELDTLEARGDSDLWALGREAELLALAGAPDPGQRARRLYPLPRIEGPEDRPRAETLAEHLTADALRLGDPRSPEYRAGCAAYLTARVIRHALGGDAGGMAPCPYTMGTAAADAYYAGVERGRAVWETCRRLLEEPNQ